MKWLYWSAGIILTLCILLFVILFTPPGNALLAPVIEKKMQTALNIPAKLEHFRLGTDHFEAVVALSEKNRIECAGDYAIFSHSLSARYRAELDDLAALQPLVKQPLRGGFTTQGTVTGTLEALKISGKSDLAGGETTYASDLIAFRLNAVELNMKNAKFGKLLFMAGQPLYADADVTLSAALAQLTTDRRRGALTLNLKKGMVNKTVIAEAFNLPLFAGTRFSLSMHTDLDGDRADGQLDFNSDLLALHAAPARYTISKQRFETEYAAAVPDLGKLSFLTEHPLRGSANVTGDLAYATDLIVHANSATLGGSIRSTFKGGKLHADLENIQTLKALYMLTYPQVFDARLHGDLDYTLITKKGQLKATLTDGKFTQNSTFDLLRNYSNINLYAERFKGDATAHIQDKILDADLMLRSNRSTLFSRHARIDGEANTIDARVHLDANNNPVDFRLKGALDHPDVAVDAGKLIGREAGKQIKRLLNDLFK